MTDFVEQEGRGKFLELEILLKLFKAVLEHSDGEDEELEPLLCRFEEAANPEP